MNSPTPSLARPSPAPTTLSGARGGRVRARGGPIRAAGVVSRAEGLLSALAATPLTISRGIALYDEGRVSATLYPHIFHVTGEGAFYRVDLALPDCGCRSWKYGRKQLARVDRAGRARGTDSTARITERAREVMVREQACKHMVAAGAKMMEIEGEGK